MQDNRKELVPKGFLYGIFGMVLLSLVFVFSTSDSSRAKLVEPKSFKVLGSRVLHLTKLDDGSVALYNLKNEETRTSRRLIVSAWNPCQIDKMALPPCHLLFQFHVKQNKYLSCSLYQRSGDVGLGVPFNIASYSFLTHIIAKHCDLQADQFVYYLGNCHIYDDHIEKLREQSTREPYAFPSLEIINKYENIEDYCIDDFKLSDYQCHKPIKMEMRK